MYTPLGFFNGYKMRFGQSIFAADIKTQTYHLPLVTQLELRTRDGFEPVLTLDFELVRERNLMGATSRCHKARYGEVIAVADVQILIVVTNQYGNGVAAAVVFNERKVAVPYAQHNGGVAPV